MKMAQVLCGLPYEQRHLGLTILEERRTRVRFIEMYKITQEERQLTELFQLPACDHNLREHSQGS